MLLLYCFYITDKQIEQETEHCCKNCNDGVKENAPKLQQEWHERNGDNEVSKDRYKEDKPVDDCIEDLYFCRLFSALKYLCCPLNLFLGPAFGPEAVIEIIHPSFPL